MDENKLKLLKISGYSIKACCAMCENFNADTKIGSVWGTCKKKKYFHKKHKEDREMSVVAYGSCSKKGFKMREDVEFFLRDWKQFLETE